VTPPPQSRNGGGEGHKLGLFAATALVMGNMIGSGVFLLPASLAPFGWNAVVAWLATISGALVLAYVLTRLMRAMPGAGGPIGQVEAAFGPLAGFLIGWSYWVSIWTAVVTIAVAAASYLSSLVPQVTATPIRSVITALVLLWLATGINLIGTRVAGRFQAATLLIKLVPLLLVMGIAAYVLSSPMKTPVQAFDLSRISGGEITAAATLTLWALLGFESASLAADRVEKPERNVARATLYGTGIAGLLYLFVCSAIALMLPPEIVSASPAPFATFVAVFWGAQPAAAIAVFAFVSCLGALNGWVLMQGELPRSMAVRGMLPQWLGRVDRNGTPVAALLLSSLIASIFVVMNAAKGLKSLFEFMLLLSTSASLWLYLAFALAAVRLKIAPVWAAIGVLYALWTLWGAGVEASGLSLLLMAAGLPMLWWARCASGPLEEPLEERPVA
jgi:basic amino acid/polyamine antiporter, APA family